MKTRHISFQSQSFSAACLVVISTLFGSFASSAQTVDYLYSGSEVVVTLNPGTYDITAYGAQGGSCDSGSGNQPGGLGAEMEARFTFTTVTNLTLLVGGAGTNNNFDGGGGGGGSFIVNGGNVFFVGQQDQPFMMAGGGGGGGLSRG
ncbi:MAG: glycine rich domain-containing protein, partial [Limisphaerales bacterium]